MKSQVIIGCVNSELRKKALENPDLSLGQILAKGKAMENTVSQAREIETTTRPTTASVNYTRQKGKNKLSNQSNPASRPQGDKKCGLCGGPYPHRSGATSCPAYGKPCNKCGKVGHFGRVCRSTPQKRYTHPPQHHQHNQGQRYHNRAGQRSQGRAYYTTGENVESDDLPSYAFTLGAVYTNRDK